MSVCASTCVCLWRVARCAFTHAVCVLGVQNALVMDLSFSHTWSQLAVNEVPDEQASSPRETMAHDPVAVNAER